MDITFVQLFGVALVYCGIHGYIKGKVDWSVEVGPHSGSDSTFNFDLTPDKYRWRRAGMLTGMWARLICIVVTVAGALLLFVFKGESIAFSL